VQKTVDSIAQSLIAISAKTAGEAIRAEDWNALVNGVRHLAEAVSELSRVVSPLGHNHPELEKKIDEIQTNFTSLVNQVSPALVELQRQINALRLQQQVADLFDKAIQAQVNTQAVAEAKQQAANAIEQLHVAVSQNPTVYSRTQREVATQLQTITETVQAAAPNHAGVKSSAQTIGATTELMRTSRTMTYEAEVAHNRVLDRAGGGGGLTALLAVRG
jgi:chromosome segregation ATPase